MTKRCRRRRVGRPLSRQIPNGASPSNIAGRPYGRGYNFSGPLSTEAAPCCNCSAKSKVLWQKFACVMMGGQRISQPGTPLCRQQS